jgi:hypothetical protein
MNLKRRALIGALGALACGCRPAFGPKLHDPSVNQPTQLRFGREVQPWPRWRPENDLIYRPASRADLVAVHRYIAQDWIYQREPAPDDRWRRGVTVGDCEDFALAVQGKLRRMGVSCRLVICWVPIGRSRYDGHCVAEIDGWISEVGADDVVPLDWLGYHWDRASGISDPEPWRLIV